MQPKQRRQLESAANSPAGGWLTLSPGQGATLAGMSFQRYVAAGGRRVRVQVSQAQALQLLNSVDRGLSGGFLGAIGSTLLNIGKAVLPQLAKAGLQIATAAGSAAVSQAISDAMARQQQGYGLAATAAASSGQGGLPRREGLRKTRPIGH